MSKPGTLVSSIVQKVTTHDQKVIDESIEKLSKRSAHLKGELFELVKQHYVNFDLQVSTTVALEQRVQEARDEYQRIVRHIEQDLNTRISKSSEERAEKESRLKETQSRIAFVQRLFDIYQAVENSRTDLQCGKYVSAAEHLSSTIKSLSEIAKEGCDAKVFRALKTEHAMVMSDLTVQLQEKWQKFVSWSPKVIPSDPGLELLSRVELHVPSHQGQGQRKDVIVAMKVLASAGIWEQRAEVFARKLLLCIIKPLIVHNTLQATRSKSKDGLLLRLSKVSGPEGTSIPQLYETLLCVLSVVRLVVAKEYEREWLEVIGRILCPEIEELVIANRLSTSIPRNSSELEQYEAVRIRAKGFEEELVKMGMVEDGKMCKMSEYASDVNIHFVNQKNQDILVKARSILLQPLHNTVMVTNVDPFSKLEDIFPVPDSDKITDEEPGQAFDIAQLNFVFPKCAVSRSVVDFVDHLYETLKECCHGSDAVQGFCLARNMVDLFCAVLSSHHSAAIGELPRMAAVQHNNCMYLAHHLMTLGHQFHSRLPPPLNSQTTTFVDQVPLVRAMGVECFLAEMKKQQSCLLDFLKSFGSFSGVSRDSHRDIVRRSLQKALLHVSKLSKVYLEVLPINIHHKAVGSLLNILVSEVIRMIMSMEDMAADDATEIHALLSVVLEKAPKTLLLTSEEEVDSISTYCNNWEKFQKLAVILNASLLEIVGLWEEGKEGVAMVFSVSEVRSLIKALFRNTEHRASALNKITS
jgi:centromere/kinetochore protein ZW10